MPSVESGVKGNPRGYGVWSFVGKAGARARGSEGEGIWCSRQTVLWQQIAPGAADWGCSLQQPGGCAATPLWGGGSFPGSGCSKTTSGWAGSHAGRYGCPPSHDHPRGHGAYGGTAASAALYWILFPWGIPKSWWQGAPKGTGPLWGSLGSVCRPKSGYADWYGDASAWPLWTYLFWQSFLQCAGQAPGRLDCSGTSSPGSHNRPCTGAQLRCAKVRRGICRWQRFWHWGQAPILHRGFGSGRNRSPQRG